MVFVLARGGLATCHDFGFMARAAVATLVAVYVPSICVARLVFQSAIGYYVAMYSSHFALIVVYSWRMRNHLRALRAGEPGPWTGHMSRVAASGASDRVPTDGTPLDGHAVVEGAGDLRAALVPNIHACTTERLSTTHEQLEKQHHREASG